jgi:hypothetical protein
LNPNAPARITLAHSSLIILGPADIGLLKELKAASERGRTIRTFSTRLVVDRLAKNGYVKARSTGPELIHYRIPAAAKMLSGITFDRR